ncbi:MAG: helix-turn-helix domain-containing protein [Gammaproteobacteria bacterium]|jgi:DNA-binding HxlR family transcriptional regulator|nr:helix-turn-helix domain-containing protein [Gammaproteobacteria bacterium]
MKPYGQFCPLAQATQLLCERWTLIIVRELIAGSTRFSELQKGVPLMSPTLLSTRLKQLIKSGVIELVGSKGSHKYHLTQAGKELQPVVELLGVWGHRWVRSNLNSGDLDAGLLMWDMRRSVDPSVFPEHRVVVQFEYPDAAKGASDWWLVSENGEVDLCLNDRGYDVDILIRCSLKTMTEIWTCEKRFNEAVRKSEIVIMGDPKLVSKLQDWLRSSALSQLGSLDTYPELNWSSGK